MRPGKLYIKILVSFLAVLFATLILIFVLFIALPTRHFTTRMEEYTSTRALIIKELVEDKIAATTITDLHDNERLKDFIFDFGEILGGKVWIQNPDGTIPLKNFKGEIPEIVARLKRRHAIGHGNMTIYHRRDLDFYAIIPVKFPGGMTGKIHVLFDKQDGMSHPGQGLALGLFIIGLMAALLIIPVTKIITHRLLRLRESALHIADGNLSHRASVTGRDEIGELARSFNQMADKLEGMIMSGKELTANVSHELRTPLTRIRVAEEMLREKLEQGKYTDWKRHLDGIQEDILELDTLINRILELSRLDIRQSPLKIAPFNIQHLIQNILIRLKPVIDRKALHLSTDLASQALYDGDEEALGTALSNIFDNAMKFTPEDGQIMVRMHPGSDHLEIRVTNTHDAIPEDDLSRIFDPFHRVTGSRAVGSGLGLAITKKIIQRHGGTIEAINAEMGLEIRIALPLNNIA